jgi:hypothetical protein
MVRDQCQVIAIKRDIQDPDRNARIFYLLYGSRQTVRQEDPLVRIPTRTTFETPLFLSTIS